MRLKQCYMNYSGIQSSDDTESQRPSVIGWLRISCTHIKNWCRYTCKYMQIYANDLFVRPHQHLNQLSCFIASSCLESAALLCSSTDIYIAPVKTLYKKVMGRFVGRMCRVPSVTIAWCGVGVQADVSFLVRSPRWQFSASPAAPRNGNYPRDSLTTWVMCYV